MNDEMTLIIIFADYAVNYAARDAHFNLGRVSENFASLRQTATCGGSVKSKMLGVCQVSMPNNELLKTRNA